MGVREKIMNIFKKLYCRVYQGIFRLILPILPYREPKILKSNNDISTLLKEKKIDNVMLVTDKTLKSIGLTKSLEENLTLSNIKVVVFSDVVANPTTQNVEDGLKLYKKQLCNGLIAFGGGSSMDCAKAIGARIVKPKKSLSKMKGLLKICKKLPLLIAIPTTAGTGSETTLAAVITDSVTRHKYAINDFSLIPHFAMLDATLTINLPKFVTATTGMDALTHAIESYIGRSTTKDTRKNALEATKLIFENLYEAYLHGENLKARQNMLLASYKAGLAFTKSYVGYVHAIAHSLGGKYNVAHGLANAVILPIMLKKYNKAVYKKLYKMALYVGLIDEKVGVEEGALLFIEKIEELNKKMNIGNTIKELKKEDIENLARTAEKEGNPLYPVPVLYTAKELEDVYYKLLV